jgi:quercetin dioxygenase-like cupin family protein
MGDMTPPAHLWFLDTLVTVRVSHADGQDGIAILEHRAPSGDSPPLHVHRTEDEIFHILDGRFRFRVGGEERWAGPGETLLAPNGIPHTYRVESREGGRWLTATAHGDFERFVRAMGRPAERLELPVPAGPPPPEAAAALAAIALQYEIEIVGPPLQ